MAIWAYQDIKTNSEKRKDLEAIVGTDTIISCECEPRNKIHTNRQLTDSEKSDLKTEWGQLYEYLIQE